jgi:hypothetical protein
MNYENSPKMFGAFRGLVFSQHRKDHYGIPNYGYNFCDHCSGIFEYVHRGSGFINSTASREQRAENIARIEAENNRLSEIFTDPSKRCTCDLPGDLEVIEKRARRDARPRLPASAPPLPPNAGKIVSSTGTTSPREQTKPGQRNLADQLQQLYDLYDSGALTDEQYEAAKNKLIGL